MFLNINDTYEWIAERNSRINKQTTLKIKLKIVIGWVSLRDNNLKIIVFVYWIWEGPITN